MTVAEAVATYLQSLERRNLARTTITSYDNLLKLFVSWTVENYPKHQVHDFTADDILDYCEMLNGIDEEKQSYSYRTDRIRCLKRLFKFLKKKHHILIDPCEPLPEIRAHYELPDRLVSKEDFESLVTVIPLHTRQGFRTRTIIELLFASGIRANELLSTTLYDLNLREGTLRVNQGKGGKDRIAILTKTASNFLREYTERVRPVHQKKRGVDALFLARNGSPLSYPALLHSVSFYAKNAGLKNVTPHAFRHGFATELARSGMSPRYIQSLLAHEHLKTTGIYTHLTQTDMKAAHQKTEPRKRVKMEDQPTFGVETGEKPTFFMKKPRQR